MRDYVLTVAYAVIVSVAINLLTPSKSYSGIIRIVSGVFVVYALLTPIKGLVHSGGYYFTVPEIITREEFQSTENSARLRFGEILSEKYREGLSRAINEELTSKWGSQLRARAEEGTVRVYNAPEADWEDIEKYIREKYGLATVFG